MQQPMPHQLMGYDRAITMFSPDGRLLQVEYAKKTVRQGSTAIGLACKDGIVLITDKRIVDGLVVPEAVEKVWEIDEHIAATASGILSDARVLIERAQLKAQQHRVTYDSAIDTLSVVKDICNLKQICTQSGGLRPFGVSILVAGIDEKPKLFETDPTGIFFQYKATVIGEGETEIEEILKKEYREDITVDEAIKLGLKALSKVLDKEFNYDRVDGAYIKMDDKKFRKLTRSEIERFSDERKGKKK
ncbi:archaeal proteasome endopeptidase complex subunit alpha [Candidatus Woesearchaeota archaeon]|nr:archaeal proteasome endopeptidase complex subunit alpha [Candidatus Woesearchaeota archaeon]